MASIAPRAVVRDDSGFFLGLAAAMAIANVLGFGLQAAMGRSSFGAPWVIHIHALTFFGWVSLFTVQSGLGATGRIAWHRQLGRLAAGWAAVMIVVGLSTTIFVAREGRVPFFFLPAYFVIMSSLSVLGFAGLLWWAVARRRETDWHRRLVMCAMTAIMGPAFGRLLPVPLLIPWSGWAIFAGTMTFPIAGMIHDLRRDGRVHPAWWYGAAILVALNLVMEALTVSPIGLGLYDWVTQGSPGAAIAPLAYPPMLGGA